MAERNPITPGMTFGYLTVLSRRPRFIVCRCICGVVKEFRIDHLKYGLSRSCGCRKGELLTQSKTRHGQSIGAETPEYKAWSGVIARCENQRNRSYANYGGRGIRVCRRWRESFEAFYEDMGPRPSNSHSIDRIDVNGDYEPSNCRWATRLVQGRNRRCVIQITHRGETLTIPEWSERTGLKPSTIRFRYMKGWPAERVLSPQLLR